ncbi:MAG: hypothetical protein ABIQ39_16115 [Ilumatobacteraceae bacterium]
MAEQVATLSLALQTVGQLQARQASVEKTAHTAKSVADRTARAVVPRDELERREKAARARVLGNLYLVSGLSITMLLLLLLGGINYLQGRNGDLYQVCVTRNATNQVVLDVLTQRDPNPAFPAPDAFQVKQTNRLKKAFAVNDCGKLR